MTTTTPATLYGVDIDKIRLWLNPTYPDTPGWSIVGRNGVDYDWITISHMDQWLRDGLFPEMAGLTPRPWTDADRIPYPTPELEII